MTSLTTEQTSETMNRFLSHTIFALAVSCTAMTAPSMAASRVAAVDRIVAVVNSDVITSVQLRDRVEQITRQVQRQGGQLPPADVLERQILERLIIEQAQLQLARETSLRVDDATLERAIARIAENNRISATELRATLERDGV